jgi:hypothetical protein
MYLRREEGLRIRVYQKRERSQLLFLVVATRPDSVWRSPATRVKQEVICIQKPNIAILSVVD